MGLAAGTILGQYEVRSPLGAGGMGEVYRAHDTRLDREVAIKVLPESLTADPERLRRFEQEARATAALNHPNILAVFQMATDNGVSYLVEELLEGETLRDRLRHGSIPLRKAPPLPSTDGKKLFVVGRIFRGESMRYDLKSGRFAPFLGGTSAEYFAFSKDGQWVTYVTYPDGVLWRSKVDGSERLQLTYPPSTAFPPLYALVPRWSPDGKQIAFFAVPTGKPAKIYEVSADGGAPQLLMPDNPEPQCDPNWSPDGSKIVFGGDAASTSEIHVLDLTTHQVSTLPNSQGLYAPRWSADGRYIAALPADSTKLLAFDLQTHKWTELAKGRLGWPNWSKDGQSLLLLDMNGTGAVIKVRLSDGKTERILDLKDFVVTGYFRSTLSLAPDDSPLLLKDTGSQDIYSLDWQEP